jgi:capsular polysaccharide transport system permease protein
MTMKQPVRKFRIRRVPTSPSPQLDTVPEKPAHDQMHPTASQIQTAQVQTTQSQANQPQAAQPQTTHPQATPSKDGQSQKVQFQTDRTQVKPPQHLDPQNNPETPPDIETKPETNPQKNGPPLVAGKTIDTTPAHQIETIQKEGLTGRQLRMARRIAKEHKLPAQTDFDAVRLLKAKGIDPFNRSNPLDWISPEQSEPLPADASSII